MHVRLLLCNKLPPNLVAYTAVFIICHFLWIRNLDIAWLGPLVEDLSQVSVKLWAGAAVYLKSQPGKYLLSNLRGFWQDSVHLRLLGWLSESTFSSLSCVLLQKAARSMADGFIRMSQVIRWESIWGKQKAQSFIT